MTATNRRRTARTYRRQPPSTWVFTILLVVTVGATAPVLMDHLSRISSPRSIPWWVLAAGFAAGHVAAMRFEFHGEMQAVTLSEVPLLLGLAFVPRSEDLLLATVVGSAVAIAWRRHPPIKAAFNLAVRTLETVVAAECFHAVLGSAVVISGRGLLAAAVAVSAANLASAVCVQAVIALSVGRVDRGGLPTLALVLSGVALLNVSVGMVAVGLLWISRIAAIPLVGIAVALGFGYRSLSQLRRLHDDLEQMYRFSRTLAGLDEAEDVIHAVLSEARTRLRGGVAELALDRAGGTIRYTLRGDGPLVHSAEPALHPLAAAVARVGHGVVGKKTTGDGDLTRALADCGFRDAVAAALPAVSGLAGTLIVADRQSDQVSFEPADLELLQVLANQTATALHAAQLLDWLRQEVADKNHLALHDPLTDLANRSLFNQHIETSLARQTDESIVAVMIMDLDRFKTVNDTLGHQSGDLILQQIAGQLTRAVGAHGVAGRLGGDEFAVVAVVADRGELAAVVRDVLVAGHAEISADDLYLDVGCSLGVALAPEHGQDRSSLLRAADVAMYHAKANEGGVAFYEPERDYRGDRPVDLTTEDRRSVETSSQGSARLPPSSFRS